MAKATAAPKKGASLLTKLGGGLLGALKGKVLGTLEAEPTRVGVTAAQLVNLIVTKLAKGKGLSAQQLTSLAVIVNIVAAEAIRAVVASPKTQKARD